MSMSKFGDFVRDMRRKRGMSQAQLAKRAQLAPGTIGDIEQGRQQATRNLDLLARALDLSPESLRECRETPEEIGVPQLDRRELALIEKFRAVSDIDQARVEAFLSGIRPTRRGPKGNAVRPPQRVPGRRVKAALAGT